MGHYVTAVDAGGVRVGETFLPAASVFWAAGVQASPLAHCLGVELDSRGGPRWGTICPWPDIPRSS